MNSHSNPFLLADSVPPSNLQHCASPVHHDIQEPDDQDIYVGNQEHFIF